MSENRKHGVVPEGGSVARSFNHPPATVAPLPPAPDAAGSAPFELGEAAHSQVLLGAIIEALDGPLCLLDRDGRILERNSSWGPHAQAHLATAGADTLTYSELLVRGVSEAGTELTELLDNVRRVCDGSRDFYHGHFSSVTESGRSWFRVRAFSLRTPTAHAAIVMHFDVTSHVIATERLKEEKDKSSKLALVAKHSESAVIITDANERIEWVNDGFNSMTGYATDEVLGSSLEEVLQGELTDPEVSARMRRSLDASQSATLELATQRKAGEPYWASLEMGPVYDDNGNRDRWFAILRDITESKRLSQRLQSEKSRAEALATELEREKALFESLLATIPHTVTWNDLELRYVGCNEAFLRLVGASSADQIVGHLANDIVHEDSEDVLQVQREVIATGQAILDREVLWAQEGTAPRDLLFSALPLRNDTGEMTGLVCSSTDLTQIRQLEQQLQQARQLEAIGQLAAGVAHEINTPSQFLSDNLNFIHDALDDLEPLLRKIATLTPSADVPVLAELAAAAETADLDYLLDEVPSAVEQSLDGISRIKQIVLAMKEFSHPSSKDKEPLDLNAAIRTTVTVAQNEWKYVADVALDLDESLPSVQAISSSINQVLLNIVVNAAHAIGERYGDSRKGTIRISTRHCADNVTVSIGDDGTGMSSDVLQRMYDPFFTTKEVGKGTGQGLSIAHQIITERHGGSVSVESTVGEGSTFEITLPRGTDIFTNHGDD